ncbi:MAG: hypothetical protein Q9216_001762 [Gyalolechia sp. 2 TL-2023]
MDNADYIQVSYRQLSRELKISNSIAKRMLSHFYQQQNTKKPGSVCAVYILSGVLAPMSPTISAPIPTRDGEDVFMQSSSLISSSMAQREDEEEPEAVRSIVMCREEDLEGKSMMALFEPLMEDWISEYLTSANLQG